MRIKLNGKKYKYTPEYYKREDDLNVELPSYTLVCSGMVFHEKKWKKCQFRVIDFSGQMKVFISPVGIYKDGMSEIGKVDSQGFVDKIEVRKFKRFLLRACEFIFIKKLQFFHLIDRAKSIKKNLLYISIALFGATAYYLTNEFYDNYLQRLINESNLIQSLIVFLSLSSIFNIFVPFSIRRSWSIGEIDKLINMRQDREKERKERQERDFLRNNRF